jgi:hypothetical protein
VAETIGHRLDQRPRLRQRLEDVVRQIDVHHVVATADVVDLRSIFADRKQIDGS